MRNFVNTKKFIRNALLLAAMSVPLPALAANKTYVGPDGGNWSVAGNWSVSGVPINGDFVFLQPSAGDRTINMDVTYSSPGIGSLFLDGSNFSTATITQSVGSLIVSGQEQIGANINGRGRYVQTGGTHTGTQMFLGLAAGASGSYELSGSAILNMNANSGSSTAVGTAGSGTFTQTGGTHNVYNLYVGSYFAGGSGNYSISNGVINATVITVGDPGNGYFTQTGGNVTTSVLQTGVGGNYNLTDGNLTVANTFINNSNYNQNHGNFTGSITNNGSLSLTGGAMTITGAGFNNASVLNLSGGGITANATFTNNGQISYYGNPVINGTAQFNNLGFITQGAGTLTINSTAFNSGNINLAAGGGLAIGAPYTNNGTISLNGGRISGGGQLVNRYGATLTGPGQIASPFDNQGGRLLLSEGTTLIINPFNSRGIIQLNSDTAALSGGAIANTGQIFGHGSIGNDVANSGTIEANSGNLIFGGVLTNASIGTLAAPLGGKISVIGGMSGNAGLINLSGGTFDNNGNSINNTGQISGFGTFRSGGIGLTNNGSVTFTGGFTTVNGNVINGPSRQIKVAYNPALFTGTVTNNGTFKTTSTTATFSGTYIENGTFISDPSDNYFVDVFLNAPGAWTGGAGDRFFVKGALDWTGGSMSGSGAQTFNQGSANLHNANAKTLSGWTFNNEKPLTLSGGNIDMGNSALINNTNIFDIQSDAGITNTLGGAATFANHATLRKSGGAGSSAVAAMVTNDTGSIDVQTGTLDLQGGLALAAGSTLQKTGAANLRIAGPQPHGANSNLNIAAGNVRLASDAGAPPTLPIAAIHNLAVNISASNTALVLESSQELRELTIPFANAGNQSLDLNSPNIPSAVNTLRVYSSTLAATKLALWSAIKNASISGSPTPTDGIYDTGRINHSNTNVGLAQTTDAHGEQSIQVRLAKIGDLNLDGNVSIADFIDLAAHFNQSGPNITWQEGDINYDGNVSIADFIDLAGQFNTTYASEDFNALASFAQSLGVDPSIIGSAVPEPTSLALLSLAALTLARRRRIS